MSLFFLILLAITIKVMCGTINIVCRERERENKMYSYKNESIKQIFNYLLGHRRALCPACRHAPQSRERFAGGSSLAEVVRRGGDEVGGGGGGGGGVDGVGVGGGCGCGCGKLSGGTEG